MKLAYNQISFCQRLNILLTIDIAMKWFKRTKSVLKANAQSNSKSEHLI